MFYSKDYLNSFNFFNTFNSGFQDPSNLHFFCVVTELYNNYVEVKSVCPVDKKTYRCLFVRRVLYSGEGRSVGFLASFHFNRRFVVVITDSTFFVNRRLMLFVCDTSYKRAFDEGGMDLPYDYTGCSALSIFDRDEKYLRSYGS